MWCPQHGEQTVRSRHRAKRPHLAGADPSPADADANESHRYKSLRLDPEHTDNSSQQLSAPAAKQAQHWLQPPDPGLGGIVIQRCGQLNYHRASSADRAIQQQDVPHCSPQRAAEAPEPGGRRFSESAEQPLHQCPGCASQCGSSAGHDVLDGADGQRRLKMVWRVKMRECVDASAVVLMQRHIIEGKPAMRQVPHDCLAVHFALDMPCILMQTYSFTWLILVL